MSDEELTSLVREAYFNANKDYIDEQIEIALKKLEHIENVEKQISNILIRNRLYLKSDERKYTACCFPKGLQQAV